MMRFFYSLFLNPALLVAALSAVLSGCASVQAFNYYRLQADAPVGHHVVKQRVGVAPVVIPDWLASSSLTWSDGYRVHRSENDRWGAGIRPQIEHVLSRDLGRQLSNQPVSVGPWLGGNRPERVVLVKVENLSLAENRVAADIIWSVENAMRDTVYRQNEYTLTIKSQAGLSREERLVQGLSGLMARLSEQIAVQLVALDQ